MRLNGGSRVRKLGEVGVLMKRLVKKTGDNNHVWAYIGDSCSSSRYSELLLWDKQKEQ